MINLGHLYSHVHDWTGLLLAIALAISFCVAATDVKANELAVFLRDRVTSEADPAVFHIRERPQRWDVKKTAVIICDMWDLHHCKRAVDRVTEMAPRMNQVIAQARDLGVFIIHAPSSCMDAYQDTVMRKRAIAAPAAKNLPKD